MKSNSLGFIGGGRITKIFLQAFANKEVRFDSIMVYDTDTEGLKKLKYRYPMIETPDTVQKIAQQSIVFIALHPPIIIEMLDHIKDSISKDTILISLAPKITIEKLAVKLATPNIARMIPNATSYINKGYNPVTFGNHFGSKNKIEIMEMLSALGETFEVEESKLEAYAILSAMLPTYFWFQWNELSKFGTKIGLSEEESKLSIMHTIDAANKLMFQSDLTADQVIDLIPVKPIAEHEPQIKEIYQTRLMGLFEKIKP